MVTVLKYLWVYTRGFTVLPDWLGFFRQIEDLVRQITDKEKLFTDTVSSNEELERLRHHHEVQMAELRKKIAALETQKDELSKELRKKDNQAK